MEAEKEKLLSLCETAGVPAAVRALLDRQDRVLLAIDGRCGSGKSTLAAALSERYGWSVAHMDDFYLRAEQRTPERYAVPGENVDHERFLAEVLRPLREGKPPLYRPLDCRDFTVGEPIPFTPGTVTVIEGSYACHAELRGLYDLRVFLTVSPEAQWARILRRNGPERAEAFRTRWIPLEEAYFASGEVAACCEYVLHTD